jgi:ParB/RepB/Spo0J family partition protein
MDSFNVPLSHLIPSKLNARSNFDPKAVEVMAADITSELAAGRMGIMNPLLVRPVDPDGAKHVDGVSSFRYEIVCGFRRFKAAELAKLEHVPVRLEKLSDVEALSRILHENRDREDFHYLDEAEAFRRWNDAGASIEQIMKEMNCKKSTVYATLALCGLTPEVKRACWEPDSEKRLPQSVAMELATVPPKLQGQALKACLSPGADGKKRTARECIELIRNDYRLNIKGANFDPDDVALKAEACGGAASCAKCQYRTGNAPELFEQAKSEHQCTNPPGFRAREDKAWARQVEDGEHNRGPRCLSDAKAKDLFTVTGTLRDDIAFVRALDPCHQDKAQRSYKTLLGPAPDKHIVLARTPSREVVQLLPTANLNKVLDDAGVIKRRLNEVGTTAAPAADADEPSAEEKKAEKERTVRRDAVTRLVVADVMSKLEKRGPDKRIWRLTAETLANSGLERIWQRRDVTNEGPSKYLDRLNEPQLANFVIEAVLELVLYPTGPKYTEALLTFAKLFSVDVKEHEKTVAAAERAGPTVKKAAVAEAAKPKADPGKPTPKPKKAVKK